LIALIVSGVAISTSAVRGQQPPVPGAAFRGGVSAVLVDVDVRDKSGRPVVGLKAPDFQILEDGKAQDIVALSYEEVTEQAPAVDTATILATPGVGRPPVDAANGPIESVDVAGHRIWMLLFDTSSMPPADLQRAADAAVEWAKEKMSPADLVAVASIGASLRILTDFTTDQQKVVSVLESFAGAESVAAGIVDASTMATDEIAESATTDEKAIDTSAQELDTFNNDVRLRGLRTLCDNLRVWQQKKALLYFSSGMQRNGADNQVEMRAAINSCVRSNVTLNPVDSRGLLAVVPGGAGRQGSRGGLGAFSGRNVADQFTQLASQQETLQTLAAETGGTAFVDTNDFGEAFDKVQRAFLSYYILGYVSSNVVHDGRYRHIQVRLKRKLDATVRARNGYYADRDFTHTAKTDREPLLQDQLATAIPATDVPLFVSAAYFRLPSSQPCPGAGRPARDSSCYYVPLSLAVSGEALPTSASAVTLDVRGFVRDERGMPFATIKDTLTVPPPSKDTLAARQVLYQTGTNLPPGHYTAKVVVRENVNGKMGTFELPLVVPNLSRSRMKISSVVLSSQLQSAAGRKSVSPLVRGDVEIIPNLTHVVSQDQNLYIYYEVYDPARPDTNPALRTSLAFYRGKVKVFETPTVERREINAIDRNAAIFQFEVPAGQFRPGLYTCQVNVVDDVAGTFTFPRLELYIRPSPASRGVVIP
jgi:VWFA-related protein